MDHPFISVVVTVKNEERHIGDLLDSLMIQEEPLEVIIIDAASEDRTQEIVKDYIKRYGEEKIRLRQYAAQRGESRNLGIRMARGEVVAFTDGDCIANPNWLKELRTTLRDYDIAAGKTINIGYKPFEELGRVELFYRGYDITYPSANLAYWKYVLEDIGGFDPMFVTAEDIDLNFRAVKAGYTIGYNPRAIIYHRARSTFVGFFKQAFWNGFGRKQLTLKHGRLWGNYNVGKMLEREFTFWYTVRMVVALLGYFTCKFFGGSRYKPRPEE